MLFKLLCNETYATRIGALGGSPHPDVSSRTTAVTASSRQLSHQDADELCNRIRSARPSRTVVLDMKDIDDASTAGFARLVLLRRELLRDGRDLRLKGLHSRAASIWRISRLDTILPLQ